MSQGAFYEDPPVTGLPVLGLGRPSSRGSLWSHPPVPTPKTRRVQTRCPPIKSMGTGVSRYDSLLQSRYGHYRPRLLSRGRGEDSSDRLLGLQTHYVPTGFETRDVRSTSSRWSTQITILGSDCMRYSVSRTWSEKHRFSDEDPRTFWNGKTNLQNTKDSLKIFATTNVQIKWSRTTIVYKCNGLFLSGSIRIFLTESTIVS